MSDYVSKSPQALEPRSARIAMDKLSRSKDPDRSAEAKRVEIQNWPAVTGQTGCTDRSDRSGWKFKFQTGQIGLTQTARLQGSKYQILSKRSLNSMKLGGKLRNYPVNISPKYLTQKIHGSREIEERSKRIGVFSRTQNHQFVRTHDSRGFSTMLDA